MAQTENSDKHWRARLAVLLGIAALSLTAIVLGGIWGIDYLVDIWWFDALGYEFYYWQRLLYRYTVFAVVMLVFFLIFFLNFWIAARFLKKGASEDRSKARERRRLRDRFQSGSIWLYGPLSAALGILIAIPMFHRWERFLFYIFGRDMGVNDPFFGRDVAFYLFSFPIYKLVQNRLLLALLILTAGLTVLYALKNHLTKRPLFAFGRGAKWHLSLLVLVLSGILIWGFMLQRYGLVYDTSQRPLFDGPGYVQMTIILPLIWACMAALAAATVAAVVVIQLGRGRRTFFAAVLLFMAVLAGRYTDWLPRLVQTYVVKPNEIEKEGPYIHGHIQATLDAYNLTDLQVRDFSYRQIPTGGNSTQIKKVLRNIPVWDADTLVEVFQQLQELRTYYVFPLVNVGRYRINGSEQQVFLSPREIDFSDLPGGARNWINDHLTYTHGHGAVMTPASQASGSPMTWYLHDIPPQSDYGLTTAQPRIYYGLGTYNYSIVPNRSGEMDYPKGDSNVMTDYDGRGGIPVSSLWRKLLLAYYLKNRNVFFSTKITDESKLLIRRNVLERVRHLVPYLKIDGSPYVAITTEGIYWMIDAYTTSRDYPAAELHDMEGDAVNYVRNAVKIVVDAYNGSVDLYVYDEEDPIIDAYRRIYPGLFKSKDQMPDNLKAHVRYPKDIFDTQMRIYAKYHQQDTRVFYQQEDLWTFAETLGEESITVPRQPYYVTLDLIKAGRMDFLLLLPMFPKNRDNLRAVAVAGCDPDSYGKIIIYNFPKGELVYGPAQIDALINQDPDIAEQFTLWDQAGSQVVRGKMIILPVGNSVLFIQPVYLKATSRVKIPELERIIMSEGEVVVMGRSVEEAYAELQRRVAEEVRPEPKKPVPPVDAAGKAPSEARHLPSSKGEASSDPERQAQTSADTVVHGQKAEGNGKPVGEPAAPSTQNGPNGEAAEEAQPSGQ